MPWGAPSHPRFAGVCTTGLCGPPGLPPLARTHSHLRTPAQCLPDTHAARPLHPCCAAKKRAPCTHMLRRCARDCVDGPPGQRRCPGTLCGAAAWPGGTQGGGQGARTIRPGLVGVPVRHGCAHVRCACKCICVCVVPAGACACVCVCPCAHMHAFGSVHFCIMQCMSICARMLMCMSSPDVMRWYALVCVVSM